MAKIYDIADYRQQPEPDSPLVQAFAMAIEALIHNPGGAAPGRATLKNLNANPYSRRGDKRKERNND